MLNRYSTATARISLALFIVLIATDEHEAKLGSLLALPHKSSLSGLPSVSVEPQEPLCEKPFNVKCGPSSLDLPPRQDYLLLNTTNLDSATVGMKGDRSSLRFIVVSLAW